MCLYVVGCVLAGSVAAETWLPSVVVTATRSAQDAFEVPAAISLRELDGADADRLGINLSEVAGAIPGLLVRNRQNMAQDEQISIRGFGARSTFGVRGVRLYVDGIPATMPDGQGQLAHADLDSAARIEVLRGPFSALYGNASGGVVQVFSADGSDVPTWRAAAAADSYNRRGSVGARGRSGAFDYNVALAHVDSEGYRRNSAARRDSFNAKLNAQLAHGQLSLIGNALDMPRAQDPLGLSWQQFRDDPRQATEVAERFNTRKRVAQQQLGALYEGGQGSHGWRLMGYAGQRAVEQYLAIPAAAQARPLHSGGVIDLDGDYRGADVRWSWRPAALELSVGFSADEQDQRRRGYENFIGGELGVRGALRRDERNRVANLDGYAQLMWPLGSNWNLSTGLRHSRVRFRVKDDYVNAGNPDDSGQRAYSAFTPVAGALYRATPRLHVYASLGEGFETPTFGELGYRPDGGSGLNFALAPARSRNVELGAKWRWADSSRAELALFRADSEDELAVASNTGGRSSYRNVGQARRQGAELSLDWTFASVWQLELAATWLQARFRSPFLACSGTPCTVPTIPVAAGARIPGVPDMWWHAELARGADLGWRASLRADGVAAVTVNDIGSARAPGYHLLGLQVAHGWALRQGNLRGFVRVDNLFDRAYVGSVIVNDGNGRYYEPGPGRGVLIGLRWSGSAR